MRVLPAERQAQILDVLGERGSARINELSQLLGVSQMTVHRDLDELAARGRVRKVRGGAVASPFPADDRVCCVCHREQRSRTPMVLHMENGTHRHTCCPHCGLMALQTLGTSVASALVADFLYGRMVNCRTASYVLAPRILFCCTPSVLAFERRDDARCFQQGFGGNLLDLDGALAYLKGEMHLGSG